jgi:hypothetical protein
LRIKWRAWKKKIKKNGYSPTSCTQFFEIFLFKKKRFFRSLGNGPGLLREWVYSALHLEVLILPKFMESGDFTFFQKKYILNLVHTWTFLSTVGILVS